MATDDSGNNPPPGGMFRIFQQSVKELGNIKDHKTVASPQSSSRRPFKGCRKVCATNTSGTGDNQGKDSTCKMEKDDTCINEHACFSSSQLDPPQRSFRSNSKHKSVERLPKVQTNSRSASRSLIGRHNEPPRYRHHVKGEEKQERRTALVKGSSYVKQKKCPAKVSPDTDYERQTISVEDWSQDLLDVAINNNITWPSGSTEVHVNTIISNKIAPSPETKDKACIKYGGDSGEIHQFVTDINQNAPFKIDNENNKIDKQSLLSQQDLNANVISSHDEVSKPGDVIDFSIHVSFADKRKIVGHENKPYSVIENGNETKKINHIPAWKNNNLSETNSDSLNNNKNMTYIPKEKDRVKSSNDWSSQLDEVDFDLLNYRKKGFPLVNSDHNEARISYVEANNTFLKKENTSENSIVEILEKDKLPENNTIICGDTGILSSVNVSGSDSEVELLDFQNNMQIENICAGTNKLNNFELGDIKLTLPESVYIQENENCGKPCEQKIGKKHKSFKTTILTDIVPCMDEEPKKENQNNASFSVHRGKTKVNHCKIAHYEVNKILIDDSKLTNGKAENSTKVNNSCDFSEKNVNEHKSGKEILTNPEHSDKENNEFKGEGVKNDKVSVTEMKEGIENDGGSFSDGSFEKKHSKHDQTPVESSSNHEVGELIKEDERLRTKLPDNEKRIISKEKGTCKENKKVQFGSNIVSRPDAEFHYRHRSANNALYHDRRRHGKYYNEAYYYESYIPPRFIKRSSPVNKFYKYHHERNQYFNEAMWSYSDPRKRFYPREQYWEHYNKPGHQKDELSNKKTRTYKNEKAVSPEQITIKRKDGCEPVKLTNQTSMRQSRSRDHLEPKVSETVSYIPEDWHAEIDEKIKDIEKAVEVLNVVESKNPNASGCYSDFKLGAENSPTCDKNKDTASLGPLLDNSETLARQLDTLESSSSSDDENCKLFDGNAYLPPSPDETEQAVFKSYIALKENLRSPSPKGDESVLSTENFTDQSLNVQIAHQPLDSFVELMDTPLDEGCIKPCKENATPFEDKQITKQVIVNSFDLTSNKTSETISHIHVHEKLPEESSYKGGSNSHNLELCEEFDKVTSESKSVSSCGIVFEMEEDGHYKGDKSQIQNFVCDLQSDTDISTENMMHSVCFGADKTDMCDNSDKPAKMANSFPSFQYDECNSVDETDELGKYTNSDNKADSAGLDISFETSFHKGNLVDIKHEGRAEVDERQNSSKIVDRSRQYFGSVNQMPPHINQVYPNGPNSWQYIHPSYYYSEDYRRWYEQVCFANYQRYMQYYGYYNVPYSYYPNYRNETLAPESSPHQVQEKSMKDMTKPKVFNKPLKIPNNVSFECGQTTNQQPRQPEADQTFLYNSKSDTKWMSENVDNKLSDYWTERMPDWVEKQSQEANLKNGEKESSNSENTKLNSEPMASHKLEFGYLNNAKHSDENYSAVEEKEIQVSDNYSMQQPNASKNTVKSRNNCPNNPLKPQPYAAELDKEENTVKPLYLCEVKKNVNEAEKDIDSKNLTDSDSNMNLVGRVCGSMTSQRKPGCVCGPDGVQYWLWKTCKCSAGRIPAIEDIIPVFPEDRSVDQGYQSFDSLVTEDTTPLEVRHRIRTHRTHLNPVFFSTVHQITKRNSAITKQQLDLEANIKPPPGFKIGPAEEILETDELHQRGHQYRMDKDQSTTDDLAILDTYSEEKNNTVQYNENNGLGSVKYRHRQKNRGRLSEIIENGELNNATQTDEMVKTKKKTIHQKGPMSKTVDNNTNSSLSENVDNYSVNVRKDLLKKKRKKSPDTRNVILKESTAKEQMDKIQNNSVEINSMLLQLRSKLEDSLKNPHDTVETSSGRWKVEPMNLNEYSGKLMEMECTTDNTKLSQTGRSFQGLGSIQVAVKEENTCKNEMQGAVDPSKHEYSVTVKLPKARNRSCTVSVSDSIAEIELKSSSSGDDRMLDEVQSQSPDCMSETEAEIKGHVMTEEKCRETGVYSRKTEAMPYVERKDLNNNCMTGVFPGYRMPYRLTHPSAPTFQYKYGPEIAPRSHTPKVNADNLQGKVRTETHPKMPPDPWMNRDWPMFQPRGFMDNPLFPSPWCMTPPPPPPTKSQMATERNRFICRPTFEQYYSSINNNILKRQDWFECPQSVAAPASSASATGITPDMNKKLSCSEKTCASTKKCSDKSPSRNKLVDYNSSGNDSDDDIEEFDLSSLDSESNTGKLISKQTSIDALSFDYGEIGHTPKRIRSLSPLSSSDSASRKNLTPRTAQELDKEKKVNLQKSAVLTRQPMRKLKLKSYQSDALGKMKQPHKQEILDEKQEKKRTLSEMIAATLKKTEASIGPEQTNRLQEQQLYSVKCQQNLPPFPPLPPFPASPFWSMYLTESKSALEGKDPMEDIYSPANPAIIGPQSTPKYINNRRSFSPAMKHDSRLLFSPSETDSENQSKKSDGLKQFIRFHSFGVKYIDTHCHLDFLFNRSNFEGNLKKYMEDNPETFPDTFEGCVAVFCYPSSFSPNDELVNMLIVEDNVWFAMGCHPKMATEFNQTAELGLKYYLKHRKCVALGEIGLDYSGTFYRHEAVQKSVFRKQLNIAIKFGKPLVIHCRDAEEDCLEILKEIVPRTYKIHCHCFTKSYANARLWIEAFPNLFIGLTPLVTYPTATPSHDLARQIPLDKLLLETDAPYFVPRCRPRLDLEFSNPGLAITVAKAVAQHQEIPVSMVLRQCRVNTKKMYGI